jgi:hypothetical protein
LHEFHSFAFHESLAPGIADLGEANGGDHLGVVLSAGEGELDPEQIGETDEARKKACPPLTRLGAPADLAGEVERPRYFPY